MRARRGRFVLFVVLALTAIPFDSVFAAAGQYTLPAFTNVGRSRSYGCVTSLSSAWSGTNADGTTYNCTHFHGGIDFSLTWDPVVVTRGGVVAAVVETNYDNPNSDCVAPSTPANYIVISHGSGQYSKYYHLTHSGSEVAPGDNVSAGQWIGTSGNSGYTCGAHLHYGLSNSATSSASANTFNPDGKWTTADPGRAPWLDDFVSQKSGTSALGSLDVCYGQTATYWVKFKNLGGRTWPWVNDMYNKGKVVLYSTNSTGTAAASSQFQATDWETSSRVTPADTSSVAPDATGTFTFGIKGTGTAGQSYTLYLNLDAFGLNKLGGFWFKYTDQVRVSVFVVPTQACP